MTIGELIGQGFHYVRRCPSLWLFGFFVGGLTGSGGGGGGGGGKGGSNHIGPDTLLSGLHLSPALILPLISLALILILAGLLLRLISEGALIEGVARARQGGTMTTSQGFRAGWAHWGVLLRIALLFVGAFVASMIVLVAPCVIAVRMGVYPLAIGLGVIAAVIAVPWLITLSMLRTYASRIAVLENRHALDAFRKARLFLHGRIMEGLKAIVASFLGGVAIGMVGFLVIVPVAIIGVLLVVAAHLPMIPVLIGCCVLLLPLVVVATAISGVFSSSVWTISYIEQAAA